MWLRKGRPNAQSAQANMGAEPEAQSVPTLEDYRSGRCTLEDLLRYLPPRPATSMSSTLMTSPSRSIGCSSSMT